MNRLYQLSVLFGLALAFWLAPPASDACEPAFQDTVNNACRVNIVAGSASGGTSSNFNSVIPSTGTAVGARDTSGSMQPLQLDGAGVGQNLNVNCKVGCAAGTSTPTDAFANPTTAGIQQDFLMGWNGTTWDRLQVDASKNLKILVNAALPAGTNTIGSVNSAPATSGGATPCYLVSTASTNSTNCKNAAGQIYGYDFVNTTATIYYLRLYNASSAPTCSSATGFIRTIPILATGGIARDISVGEAYATGIGFCLTGGGSSTDNTNAAAGVYVTIHYK